ncbi:TIM-barrel domain-containing protein [Pseudohoeflea coraliihabitans]|uniref:Alpha-glucosidase n=1 Tax=Pseudohoeflea coraliihabitans TaxID=2860393 RepID=A0ABS6WQQ6_9HYPH|nr:TIM-barrel domain-containing protein [Pseudohoeflea sp. DP4N28-3]MBW3097983.1 hypothetical protein [Pseudohoeflea sp. DP4N28-3]
MPDDIAIQSKVKNRPSAEDAAQVYRYVPVNQFTPLDSTNWLALTEVTGAATDASNSWRSIITATATNRGTGASAGTYTARLEVISYINNIFRLRFDPTYGVDDSYPDIAFGPVTQVNLDTIRSNEIADDGAPETLFDYSSAASTAIQFTLNDIRVVLTDSFQLQVYSKTTGSSIYSDALCPDTQYYGGLTFVDPAYGSAVATFWENNKDASQAEEFFGQGEVNTYDEDGYYVVRKNGNIKLPSASNTGSNNGASMTNYNYDQISYQHSELYPNANNDVDTYGSTPNYYYPLYFSAPWLIVAGDKSSTNPYAYGIFLNNQSQTYTNTGDTSFGDSVGQSDLCYMGAQYGEIDKYFVFGAPEIIDDTLTWTVRTATEGLAYLCSNPGAALTKYAALPPKYLFGYFQGVYGALAVTDDAFETVTGQDISYVSNGISFDTIVSGYSDAGIPLEGLAVDIDVQQTYEVFTTNARFWTGGAVGSGDSIFAWAKGESLVTQTNITCFIRDDQTDYDVYTSLSGTDYYLKADAADGSYTTMNDGSGYSDAYCGQLQYGSTARCTAVFPDWGADGTPAWWGANYKDLFDIGLDFVWQDMTTPSMDTHEIGDPVTTDVTDMSPLEQANYDANTTDVDYADKFNWRSFHPQQYITDPRFGDGAQRTFAEVRNEHAYMLCSATYDEGIKNTESSRDRFKRSYIIARGGQIGSQQYGGLWMGDNGTDWSYLDLLVPMIVNMNLSGVSVVGADVGGFFGYSDNYDGNDGEGPPATSEMITRWVQAAFMMPWFRNHYDRWIGKDPSTNASTNPDDWEAKGHGKPYQECYMYTDTASGSTTYADVMATVIKQRYMWQEVLYTGAYKHATSGRPMLLPMRAWAQDSAIDYDTYPGLNSQFLTGGYDGKQILFAPICDESTTSRTVYFPDGANWFPYYLAGDTEDLDEYQKGGAQKTVDADVTNSPIYVQEGAVLPTRYTLDGSVKPITSYEDTDPLVFDVFGAKLGNAGECYLDDGGVTTNAEDTGSYEYWNLLKLDLAEITDTTAEYLLFYLNNGSDDYFTFDGVVYVRLRAVGTLDSITVNGGVFSQYPVATRQDFFDLDADLPGYWLEESTGSVWIRIPAFDANQLQNIVVTCSDSINIAKSL